MTKVILLNGPASSGKDTIGEQLMLFPSVRMRSFKKALIDMTLRIFPDVSREKWDAWYTREGKELPREELGGRSQREALIWVSEDIGKPTFGNDVWGKAVANTMPKDGAMYVLTDSGFPEEAQVLVDKFGKENVHIIRLHRAGYTFKGDSRRYLSEDDFTEEMNFYDISLTPYVEGETHRSVTKRTAEEFYKLITGLDIRT